MVFHFLPGEVSFVRDMSVWWDQGSYTFLRFNCKEVKLFYSGRGLTLVMIIWGQGINLSYPAFGFFVLFWFWRQAGSHYCTLCCLSLLSAELNICVVQIPRKTSKGRGLSLLQFGLLKFDVIYLLFNIKMSSKLK